MSADVLVSTRATAIACRISKGWQDSCQKQRRGDISMRKAILLGAALMLSGALALAQDTTTTTSTTENTTAASNTVQGCLSGTSGNYMLTDATGAMYQVQ